MANVKELTCIICPMGCALRVEGDQVTGNQCPRGRDYALAECAHPTRTLTTTIRVGNRRDEMVSVKSSAPLPKEKLMEVMARVRRTRAQAPIAMGQALIKEVWPGVDMVATQEIP